MTEIPKRALVCRFDQEPEIESICLELQRRSKAQVERLNFVKRQIEEELNRNEAVKAELWQQIEALAKTRQLLPEGFDTNKDMLVFDEDLRILFCMKNAKQPGPVHRNVVLNLFE